MKYRKNVIVDAIQLSKDNYRLVERFSQGAAYPANVAVSNGRSVVREVYIRRPKGPQRIKVGDWVVRDEHGEFYACPNDVFVRHYQKWEDMKNDA